MYDVIIVGGGVSGLGAAITLGSSEGNKIGKFQTLVIDDGNSDFLKAKLYNVPFLPHGTSGKEALDKLREDTLAFESVSFTSERVVSIDGEFDNFTVKTKNGIYLSKEVILASGCHSLDVLLNGKNIPTKTHKLMPKEGKVRVEFNGRGEIQNGLYVAGLLSGVTTMYATALGSGVEVASAILSKRAKKIAVIHDFEGSR